MPITLLNSNQWMRNYIAEFTMHLINEQTLWSSAKFWIDRLLQRQWMGDTHSSWDTCSELWILMITLMNALGADSSLGLCLFLKRLYVVIILLSRFHWFPKDRMQRECFLFKFFFFFYNVLDTRVVWKALWISYILRAILRSNYTRKTVKQK